MSMCNEQALITIITLQNTKSIDIYFDCESQFYHLAKEPRESAECGGQRDIERDSEDRVGHRKEDSFEVESQVKMDVEIEESIHIIHTVDFTFI